MWKQARGFREPHVVLRQSVLVGGRQALKPQINISRFWAGPPSREWENKSGIQKESKDQT